MNNNPQNADPRTPKRTITNENTVSLQKNTLNADQKLLKHITEEMYKQNTDLAIKNKTLSTLRTLYSIIISTLTVKEVCEKIVDTVSLELGIETLIIFLTDKEEGVLRPVAVTSTSKILSAFESVGKSFHDLSVDLNSRENLMSVALEEGERKVTGNLLDIVTGFMVQEEADRVENETNVKTIVVYPILLGDRRMGCLIFALTKKADDLSRTQRETLEELINLVAIAIDRTQLHENLKHANIKLLELDKLKDEFVSLTSHELRSPLTAINGYLSLVLRPETKLDEKTREKLKRVYESGERLVALVNDMLDVSRIESGRIQLNPQRFSLSQLVSEVKDELATKSGVKKLQLVLTVEKEYEVIADKAKIRQVIINILDNAIKFTPEKGLINMKISQNGPMVEMLISDTGIGISQEDLPKLFTKFGRLDSSYIGISVSQGTGLGLYISKKLIEASGGKIEAESAQGKGTCFRFTLKKA